RRPARARRRARPCRPRARAASPRRRRRHRAPRSPPARRRPARLARRLRRRRPPPLSAGRRAGARGYAGSVVPGVPVGARSAQGRVPQLALGSRWLRGGRARVPGRCRCGAPWPRGAARRRVHHRPHAGLLHRVRAQHGLRDLLGGSRGGGPAVRAGRARGDRGGPRADRSRHHQRRGRDGRRVRGVHAGGLPGDANSGARAGGERRARRHGGTGRHRPGTARPGGSLELVAGNTRRRPVRLGGSATGPILELPRRDRRVYSGSMSPSHRIFLLSPAHCSGKRAGFLLRKNARSTLAQRLRSTEGANIGEVFTFMSGLYFRGKLAYAAAFANPPEGCSGIQVIVPGLGLCPPRAMIDLDGLRAIAQVPVDPGDRRYTEPWRPHAAVCRRGSRAHLHHRASSPVVSPALRRGIAGPRGATARETGDEHERLVVDGREVTISNPGKVLFPKPKYTKLDLVRYYLAVAEGALRGAGGRPNVLVRYPNGITGEFFYQKRAPEARPAWIEVVTLRFPSGRTAEEVAPRDAAALAWLANLACLELHPHPVRAEDLDHPDELRVDLDPVPGVKWAQVRQVAHVVDAVLRDVGLTGWPKTSGSRGLHVLVRIERRWGFDAVRPAALALARAVERRVPKLATSKWWKEERHGVFVD